WSTAWPSSRISNVLALDSRIANLETAYDRETAELIDPGLWDWYAESCSCGLPPGECRVQPRARPSQRPPAGDWRVWAYVAGPRRRADAGRRLLAAATPQ